MLLSLPFLLVAGTTFTPFTSAQVAPKLTGTWTTKSRQVFTGPVRILEIHNVWLLQAVVSES